MIKLHFGKANAKLIHLQKKTGKIVQTFSTLSGWSCPGSRDCQSFAVETPEGMRIRDGKHTLFRCFSASQEVLFPTVYSTRKENMGIIEMAAIDKDSAADYFVSQLPKRTGILRFHVGGEWKTQNYFDMGIKVAKLRPDILFYSYTKSIPFWVARLGDIPDNFVLTASLGGRFDELALTHNLRYCRVVFSNYEARKLKLPIDHDDSKAIKKNGNFALLLHGTMAKGSKASKAWKRIKASGGGYSRKNQNT